MRYLVAAAMLLTLALALRFAVVDVQAAVVDDGVPEFGNSPADRFHAFEASTDGGGNRD